MRPILLFFFQNLFDPILGVTPLLGLILAIAGTYIVVKAWTADSKRFDLLGAVLLGLGIFLELLICAAKLTLPLGI